MVFVLPNLDNSITVSPGKQATIELQPFVWGPFTFFCLTGRAHIDLAGGSGTDMPGCGLDAYILGPHALSSGTLHIERHARMELIPTPPMS